ncbi:MAG: hypothetical protein R2712_28485 [Vicinamibacterales bacterium]
MSLKLVGPMLVLVVAFSAASAFAQPLGTFRWQLQPYCNAITVTVTQQGGIYTLVGTDDRCGAAQPGSAIGTAYLMPQGAVGMGITTVLPNGTPVHTEATLSIASLNGTWRDSAGNAGSFTFTPGAPSGGTPRPVSAAGLAPASITSVEIANSAVSGTTIVDGSITHVDIGDAPRATFVGSNNSLTLTSTARLVASATLAAPAAGTILVNASAYISFTGASADTARCSITTLPTIDSSALSVMSEGDPGDNNYVAYAQTRGFTVAAGTSTINLICQMFAGSGRLFDANMTALFVAQ